MRGRPFSLSAASDQRPAATRKSTGSSFSHGLGGKQTSEGPNVNGHEDAVAVDPFVLPVVYASPLHREAKALVESVGRNVIVQHR